MARASNMVGLSGVASVTPVVPGQHAPNPGGESRGEFPVDLHRMRAVFPDRWTAFLKSHFRDARHVQFALGVSERTARDWLAGTGSPRAEVALHVVATYPDALAALTGGK